MRATLAALAALLLLAGCGARTAETRNTNIIVAGWIAGPQGFNPYVSIGSAATMIEDLIYSPLIDFGPDLKPRWSTSLASKVDITNGGTRYVVHLRHSARWIDGVPITSKDVVFTILLERNPHVISGYTSDFTLMRSIRATDPYTVEILLTKPSPPFLMNALSREDTLILPQHILGKYPPDSEAEAKFVNTNAEFSQHPVTSGPWRILRHVPDAYIVLQRSETYWGPQPRIEQIAFRVYPQQDSLYAAVDAGEIDVTDIPPNLWRVHGRLRGNHKFINWPWNVTFLLLPNYHDPGIGWMRDPTVKQAMMYAINRDFIVRGIMSGQANILNGPIPSFSPYYNRSLKTYGYDPARARRMLDTAGWRLQNGVRMKNGAAMRVTLKTGGATDAVASNIAELIQADFKAVGIECTLENEELQTFFVDLHNSRFQLALRGLILPPYPDDYKYYYSTQTRANGGYNLGFYSNSQIDQAILEARTAPSAAVARTALNRYQELASDDLPVLYLYSNRLGAVVPRNLTGYDLDPLAPAALPMGLQFWRMHP
ncbi:MAG TPA: peptide ABC transporter substrate-binding protein [Candidatus Baltobacteraceae bacterium]|nr:peptide ABC transporter substrate-binding protein [Candidatus Baltobacteraceae bacterium]